MSSSGDSRLTGDVLIETLKKGCQGFDHRSCYLASLNLLGAKHDSAGAQEMARACLERPKFSGSNDEVIIANNCMSLWFCLTGLDDYPADRAKQLPPSKRQGFCLEAETGSTRLTWGLDYTPVVGELPGVPWTKSAGYGSANLSVLPHSASWFCFNTQVNQEGVDHGFERTGDFLNLCSPSLAKCQADREDLEVNAKFTKTECYPGGRDPYCRTHDGPGRYVCSASQEGCEKLDKLLPGLHGLSGCVPVPYASKRAR